MKPSQNAKIGAVLLGLVLLTTLKHSAFSYLQITPVKFDTDWMDWTYSVLVVLVLDAAILYASYRGRIDLARIAAFTVGALSLAAFWSTDEEFTLTQWVAVVAFSVIIPYLQYELAEIFAADLHRADDYLLRGQRIEELERERDHAVNRISVLEQARTADQERIAELETALEEIETEVGKMDGDIALLEETAREEHALHTAAIEERDQRIAEQGTKIQELTASHYALARERDALRTDLHTMTGARDQAAKDRDGWKATAKLLQPYHDLHDALQRGPVTLGRNQILVPERTVTKDNLMIPFRIANNNDPALKKDFADSE